MPLVRSLKFVSEYIYNRKIILLSGILSEYETEGVDVPVLNNVSSVRFNFHPRKW